MHLSPVGAWAIALSFLALLAVTEFVTGFRYGILRFALIPISFLTWARGRTAGLLIAGFASLVVIGPVVAKGAPGAMFFWNAAVRLGFYAISVFVFSALRESLREEMSLARTDFLTGVANRRFFMELAVQEIKSARRYNRPFIVAYADVDHFKSINDRFGHNQGDALLRLVAHTIRSHLREVDIVARLGGDEFALLLPETGAAAAREVMSKVQAGLEKAVQTHDWPVTFSIGTVIFMTPPVSVDEMIKRADMLMYQVKRSGKKNVEYEIWEGTRS